MFFALKLIVQQVFLLVFLCFKLFKVTFNVK